jgi:protein TonB
LAPPARSTLCPPAARDQHVTGSVSVAFSIAASGTIVSHSITRSSGNAAVDAAVHQIMSAAHPPPAPGRHFHGSISLDKFLGRDLAKSTN